MSVLVSFVNEIEEAIASGDPIKRVETLRRMTDLFVEQAAHLKELHVTVFDEVILRLSRDLEFRARVELSDRLAGMVNAPRKVVRDLALDADIAIAGPVLERSCRLDEEDLVAVAEARSQDHLMALSRRATLSERLTDILVDRGDRRVVQSVAGNNGARFSRNGFRQLIGRAGEDVTLRRLLEARRDIPPHHMARLVAIAREQARESLVGEFGDAADGVIDAAIDEASRAVARQGGTKALVDDFDAAVSVVTRQARTGELVEEDIADWIKEGRIEEALAAMAQLAGLPVDMVARAYHASHYDPLLFIVRSLRFGWGTFKLLLTSKAGRQPPPDVLKSAFDGFQQLSVQTAQRIVRFTVARRRAIEPRAA